MTFAAAKNLNEENENNMKRKKHETYQSYRNPVVTPILWQSLWGTITVNKRGGSTFHCPPQANHTHPIQ